MDSHLNDNLEEVAGRPETRSADAPEIDRGRLDQDRNYPPTHRPYAWRKMASQRLGDIGCQVTSDLVRRDHWSLEPTGESKVVAAQITAFLIELGRSLRCLTLDDSEDSLARGLVLAAGLCLATVEEIKPRSPADQETGQGHHLEALLVELNERYGWADLTTKAIREMDIAGDLLQPLLWTLEESLKDQERDLKYARARASRLAEIPF